MLPAPRQKISAMKHHTNLACKAREIPRQAHAKHENVEKVHRMNREFGAFF
jgi:hypothetical protein